MKLEVLLLAAILAVLASVFGSGCAHDRNSAQTSQANPTTSNGSYLTGSYLQQDVNRHGPVTDGRSDVRVIDRSDINRSGGGDVQQSLRQLGVTH